MGTCQSNPDGTDDKKTSEHSKALNEELVKDQKVESKVIKLLLLGTGESGKSTIFKQMQLLYSQGFTQYEKTTYRHVVRRNIVESMQTLLQGAERFGFRLDSDRAKKAAEYILSLDPLAAKFWPNTDKGTKEITEHLQVLWPNEEAVKRAFDNKSRLQLPDSANYLFNNIERIANLNYEPTPEDILRARLRTSGIVERTFKINGVDFKFLDVGGQRNERRKWIHCFENVTSVIFVAAISEYDQVLYEDEKKNRLEEALHVFENICNNHYFEKTDMIIFFNKIDLFRDKIGTTPLKNYFPEYNGIGDYSDASEWIKEKFLEANRQPKDIFAHFTCATDTDNVEKVFDATRKIILKKNLQLLGLT